MAGSAGCDWSGPGNQALLKREGSLEWRSVANGAKHSVAGSMEEEPRGKLVHELRTGSLGESDIKIVCLYKGKGLVCPLKVTPPLSCLVTASFLSYG